MRALVAGGAGFVGSHLCDALLAEGFEVLCVDSLITGRARNIAHLQGQPRFTFREQDICAPFSEQADWVFQLASPASPPRYLEHPIETLLTARSTCSTSPWRTRRASCSPPRPRSTATPRCIRKSRATAAA
jgi:UDP-glucuronate decarboxylase